MIKNEIDFNMIDEKITKQKTSKENEEMKNLFENTIKNNGLSGFFKGQKTTNPPLSIVLDYDVELVKKELYQ